MIIDVHGHISSAEAVRRSPMPPSLADVEGMIEAKAQAGIDLTIVGSPSGGSTMAPAERINGYRKPFDQLRAMHDWMGTTVTQWWQYLRAYAYCDVFGDERSFAATRETLRQPGFVGIIANFSTGVEYLDSARADDFFAFLEEVQVPVLLHAGPMPACCRDIANYGMLEMFGRPSDAALGLSALVLSGRLEKHPTLKFISANSGGAFSLLADRIDLAVRPRHWDNWLAEQRGDAPSARPSQGAPDGLHEANRSTALPSEMLRRLYVDTTANQPYLHMSNLDTFGAQHVVFGTDAPPVPVNFKEKVAAIRALPVSVADQEDILSGNALRLFDLADFRSTPGLPATGVTGAPVAG